MDEIKVCILTRDKFRYIGLASTLCKHEEFAVPDTFGAQDEAGIVAKFAPDVLVLDVTTIQLNLASFVRTCRQLSPHTKVFAIGIEDDESVLDALLAGIHGNLEPFHSVGVLPEAIRQVNKGNAWVSRKIFGRFIDFVSSAPHQNSRGTRSRKTVPTETQRKVLTLLAREGLTNRQIAAQLAIDERTVEFHMSNLLRKFHLSNRNQLVIYALRQNLVQ